MAKTRREITMAEVKKMCAKDRTVLRVRRGISPKQMLAVMKSNEKLDK